jgi:hypothetical protein
MKIGKELRNYWVMSVGGEVAAEGYSLEVPWVNGEFAVIRQLEDDKSWIVTELTTGLALRGVTGTSPRKAANKLKKIYGPEHPCWTRLEPLLQDFIKIYGKRGKL